MGRHGKSNIHRTVWYSVLHLLVDEVCAIAMFGRFFRGDSGYFSLLLYNFCAFALQMPLGVLLDAMPVTSPSPGQRGAKKPDHAFLTATAGIFCTLAGAFLHPVVLGIGNALFHVGGGVGTIIEDRRERWHGRGLGVFVSPGALGLYVGTLLGKGEIWETTLWAAGIAMILLYAAEVFLLHCGARSEVTGVRKMREGSRPVTVQDGLKNICSNQMPEARTESPLPEQNPVEKTVRAAIICTTVVILRSYVGMAVAFPWKTGAAASALAVLAVAGGKAAGGFAAARWGFRKTVTVSLGLAALCYLFSIHMPLGMAAVFLFNMTMPLTLYGMVCLMPDKPGFAFGLLTFALFLGFLPGYLGLLPSGDGAVLGSAGSLLTLSLLLAAGIGGLTSVPKAAESR